MPTLMVSMAGRSSQTLAANAGGNYGWQVRVGTLAANADGDYGWQVRVMTLAADPDGIWLAGSSHTPYCQR